MARINKMEAVTLAVAAGMAQDEAEAKTKNELLTWVDQQADAVGETEQNEDTEQPEGELSEEELEAALTERAELLARLAELDGVLATAQNHVLITSTVGSPVAKCREIFVAMRTVDPAVSRKAVLDKCTAAGIAPNTAKTQYQVNKRKWEQGELAPETVEAEA